jgi:hypothetical protein
MDTDLIRTTLEDARHRLVTLNGLTASDGLGAYGDALYNGCDNSGAWDCFKDETWTIDETAGIAKIDAALAALGSPNGK